MDKKGYGRCRKMDRDFVDHGVGKHLGEFSCYLDENSKCKDAIKGKHPVQDKLKSALACKGK